MRKSILLLAMLFMVTLTTSQDGSIERPEPDQRCPMVTECVQQGWNWSWQLMRFIPNMVCRTYMPEEC